MQRLSRFARLTAPIADNQGGFAINIQANGATIRDSTIANNTGKGGILGEGNGVGHSLVITRNSIVGNQGGGIQLNTGVFTLTGGHRGRRPRIDLRRRVPDLRHGFRAE